MDESDRREYLEEEIDRLQDEKMEALSRSQESEGEEKGLALLDFLELDKRQSELEEELDVMEASFGDNEY